MKTFVKIVLAILLFGFIRHNIDLFPLTSLIVFILCYIGIDKLIGDVAIKKANKSKKTR